MLQTLQQLITAKNYAQALNQLFLLLNQFEVGADHDQQYLINRIPQSIKENYNELATAIVNLFKASSCQLSQQQYDALVLHKQKLTMIFALSEYGNTDVIVNYALKKFRQTSFKQSWLIKIYLLYDFYNTAIENPDFYFAKKPNQALPAILALLSHPSWLTEQATLRYQQFINTVCKNKKILVPDYCIPLLAQAWYQAAYIQNDTKYQLLSWLNSLLLQWLNHHNIKAQCSAPTINHSKRRPRLVVMLEHFKSNHAMYRCFANAIEMLSHQYELIAVAEANEIDVISRELFHDWLTVDITTPDDIAILVGKINQLQPDACYFTSVGMKAWCIALANLRLAPIQFITAGHPISACTKTIDFMLLEEHKFIPGIHFQEKILGLPSGNFGFVLPNFTKPMTVLTKNNNTIKIALVGSIYKINTQYLKTCQMIADKSNLPLQFCSFSGSRGLQFYYLSKFLRQWFSDVLVFPALKYEDYLHHLAECDIYLAPFPFGGTNSTVDCVLLNIPTVALAMPDLACSDSFILQKVGLEELIAEDQSQYIAKAISLIHNAEKRKNFINKLTQLDANLGGLLGNSMSGKPYLDVISKACQHHAYLKQHDKVFYSYQELINLS
ncbi:MAG: glycosyl transferase [Gammaproteobacteria bacterium]